VNIRGRAVTGLDAEELAQSGANIGFVLQSYHLFPTLTAANIGDVSALRVRAGAFRGRVSSIARVVGLSRINSGDPRKFSDVDVLKVLVELPNPGLLVVGEQVDVYFKSSGRDAIVSVIG
jgi:predicted ABC-type transport system involved in lysophospholipase L1 biosynthesis ATPase subunit